MPILDHRQPSIHKLLAEKCDLGFPSRRRSEHSDEQAAEQLQEVKHPEARIAHRGSWASADMIFGSHSSPITMCSVAQIRHAARQPNCASRNADSGHPTTSVRIIT